MAQLALEEKLAGEAQTVLEQGFTKKVFTDQREVDVNKRLLAAAKKEVAADKAALATERSGSASRPPRAMPLVKVGAQYLSFGDAAKAAKLIQRGITKGSIAKGDPKRSRAHRRGQHAAGHRAICNNNKAEAAKAFRTREAATRPWCASPSSGCSTPEQSHRANMKRPVLARPFHLRVQITPRALAPRAPRRPGPAARRYTSSLCCPSSGAGVRIELGLTDRRGATFCMRNVPNCGCWRADDGLARPKCGSSSMSGAR